MEKSDRQLLIESNEFIRSLTSVITRKGASTNWSALLRSARAILNEQHSYLHPTVKQLRKMKLKIIDEQNPE